MVGAALGVDGEVDASGLPAVTRAHRAVAAGRGGLHGRIAGGDLGKDPTVDVGQQLAQGSERGPAHEGLRPARPGVDRPKHPTGSTGSEGWPRIPPQRCHGGSRAMPASSW